jgi:thymidylate synthase
MNSTEENQYLNLIKDILEKGSVEKGRNGIVKSLFGYSMRFSLKDGVLPLLTTKRTAWKTCFHELMWFVRGSTNNKDLTDKGVHIWDSNASREFLDSRGLTTNYVNDLGPIYGHQWRHFNAPYSDCFADYKGCGIDQLQQIIDQLRTEEGRTSRRLIMTAWNPCQLDQMALPPCHVMAQFHVREQKYLSCSLYQRSGDVGLGVPFNIASYSFLTHILAKHCNLIAEDFVYFLGNAHIYESHIPVLEQQILRNTYPFPRIAINNKHDSINDYSLEDIVWIQPYQFHETLKMDMVA